MSEPNQKKSYIHPDHQAHGDKLEKYMVALSSGMIIYMSYFTKYIFECETCPEIKIKIVGVIAMLSSFITLTAIIFSAFLETQRDVAYYFRGDMDMTRTLDLKVARTFNVAIVGVVTAMISSLFYVGVNLQFLQGITFNSEDATYLVQILLIMVFVVYFVTTSHFMTGKKKLPKYRVYEKKVNATYK